jgi:soluble lytic murein transglycosylase-like protein
MRVINNYVCAGLAMLMMAQVAVTEADAATARVNKRKDKKTQVQQAESTPVIQSTTIVMADGTMAPDIPDEVTFCGQKIDLTRYDLRERFDRELMAMMYMHSSTLLLIKRANRYFPVIEPILKANGIPDDFKYLACIESTLNHRAVSSARAVGMWQFIPETGREYGLEINDEVDERYNVEKATEAACLYLNYAYSLYGDWPTAAASYNTGYVRISKELLRQRASKGLDLWLVDETMRYVFRIIACKEFLLDPKKYHFYVKKEQLYPPFTLKDTLISGKVTNWVDVADSLGLSFYDLKSFNTWIRSDSLMNDTGKIYKVQYPLPESKFYDVKQMPVHQKNWVIEDH